MADYGRYDADERRHGAEERGRRGSMFGRGWTGLGPDPRGGSDDRSGGWFGSGRDRDDERRERSASWFDPGRGSDEGRRERGGRGREGDWSFDRHPGGDRMQRDRDFGYDDRHDGLPIEETSRLIASNKVEGTPVYSRDRHRLGTIYNFMVDKISGQVEYAVLRYGGFLGMGQRYYPLPWRVLTYDRDAGGYVIDMLARDFEDAPSFDRDSEPEFDRDYGRRVHSWYGLDY